MIIFAHVPHVDARLVLVALSTISLSWKSEIHAMNERDVHTTNSFCQLEYKKVESR
jgi:hypothetical protein